MNKKELFNADGIMIKKTQAMYSKLYKKHKKEITKLRKKYKVNDINILYTTVIGAILLFEDKE